MLLGADLMVDINCGVSREGAAEEEEEGVVGSIQE